MNTSPNPAGHLDVGGVFSRAGDVYRQSFGTIWLLVLAVAIPVALVRGLLEVPDGGFISWLLSIVSWVVGVVGSVWIAGGLVRVVQDFEADDRLDAGVGELLGSVAPKLVPLFFLAIVYSILVGIGLVLLVIPGLFLIVLWVVAIPSMVVEDEGVFGSLGRSAELTRHNRWRIVWLGILIAAIELIAFGVVFGLANLSAGVGIVAGIVAVVLLLPYLAILRSVLYFRLLESGSESGAVEAVSVVEESEQESSSELSESSDEAQ